LRPGRNPVSHLNRSGGEQRMIGKRLQEHPHFARNGHEEPSMLAQRSTRRKVIGGAVAATVLSPAIHSVHRTAAQPASGHAQAVVTAHSAATDAAVAMLAQGGTAADAAIAA